MMLGATAVPSIQVAWVTVGAAGATGWHAAWLNLTVYVAVAGDVRVHPAGIRAGGGSPTPVASTVAVTVTD